MANHTSSCDAVARTPWWVWTDPAGWSTNPQCSSPASGNRARRRRPRAGETDIRRPRRDARCEHAPSRPRARASADRGGARPSSNGMIQLCLRNMGIAPPGALHGAATCAPFGRQNDLRWRVRCRSHATHAGWRQSIRPAPVRCRSSTPPSRARGPASTFPSGPPTTTPTSKPVTAWRGESTTPSTSTTRSPTTIASCRRHLQERAPVLINELRDHAFASISDGSDNFCWWPELGIISANADLGTDG